MDFNFKEWSDLYQVDPEAYERRRGAVLEHFIQSADPDNRLALEQTLFKLEMIRKRAKTPLKSAIEASKLMWESFGKLQEQIEVLQTTAQPQGKPVNTLRLLKPGADNPTTTESATDQPEAEQTASANVLHFPIKGPRNGRGLQ